MPRRGKRVLFAVAVFALVCVFAAPCPAKNFDVSGFSAEDLKKWNASEKILQREFDVCLEHCGQDQACGDKCVKAFEAKQEKEYKKFKK